MQTNRNSLEQVLFGNIWRGGLGTQYLVLYVFVLGLLGVSLFIGMYIMQLMAGS